MSGGRRAACKLAAEGNGCEEHSIPGDQALQVGTLPMSYVKRGINPFTKEQYELFNFGAFLASATPNPGQSLWATNPRAEGGIVKALLPRAVLDGCGGLLALSFPASLSAKGVVPVQVESRSAEPSAPLGSLGDAPLQDAQQSKRDVRVALKGDGHWGQVDDTVRAYFVSGAYLCDPTAVEELRRAGVNERVFVEGEIADLVHAAHLLDAARVEPALLTGGLARFTLLAKIADPQRELFLGAASYLFGIVGVDGVVRGCEVRELD